MDIRKVIVLQGLPGCGKTTWAREWISEDPERRVRFNRDDIRNMLGSYWVPSREPLINGIYQGFLDSAMVNGYDIVIDNMNLNPATLQEIEEAVADFNEWIGLSESNIRYEVEYKSFFEVPLSICISRDAEREHPVGESVIRGIFNKYRHLYAPWKYFT